MKLGNNRTGSVTTPIVGTILSLVAGWWLMSFGVAAEDVRVMRTPGEGLQPQVVVDNRGATHLVYLKGDPGACNVFYVRREPGGTNLPSPLQVNSEPKCAVALGTVRGAQLALGAKGRVHVVWNGS